MIRRLLSLLSILALVVILAPKGRRSLCPCCGWRGKPIAKWFTDSWLYLCPVCNWYVEEPR